LIPYAKKITCNRWTRLNQTKGAGRGDLLPVHAHRLHPSWSCFMAVRGGASPFLAGLSTNSEGKRLYKSSGCLASRDLHFYRGKKQCPLHSMNALLVSPLQTTLHHHHRGKTGSFSTSPNAKQRHC